MWSALNYLSSRVTMHSMNNATICENQLVAEQIRITLYANLLTILLYEPKASAKSLGIFPSGFKFL